MDKQREEFETWWRSNQLKTFPKDYEPSSLANWGADYKRHAWLAWKAAQPAPDHLPEAGNMVQQPAWAQPSQAVELSDEEQVALLRFNETCEDGQGYDVKTSMMSRLAEIGVVSRKFGSVYFVTEYGQRVIAAINAKESK